MLCNHASSVNLCTSHPVWNVLECACVPWYIYVYVCMFQAVSLSVCASDIVNSYTRALAHWMTLVQYSQQYYACPDAGIGLEQTDTETMTYVHTSST